MDDFFTAPLEWLAELAEEQITGLGVMCQLLMIGILAAALHGSFLTPGTNADAGRKVEQLVASYQPDIKEDNAWPQYIALCDLATETNKRFWAADLEAQNRTRAASGKELLKPDPEYDVRGHEVICTKCDAEVRSASRQMVAAYRAAGIFELEASISPRQKYIRPIPNLPDLEVQRLDVGTNRTIIRVGAARMFIAHEARDDAEWAAAIRDPFRACRPLACQATVIERLTFMINCQLILGEIRRELIESPPSAVALRSALASIDELSGHPPYRLVIEGERLSALDAIARTYTDDGNGDGQMILAEVEKLSSDKQSFLSMFQSDDLTATLQQVALQLKLKFPSKRETTVQCNRIFDSAAEWLALSPHERAKPSLNPDTLIQALKDRRELVLGIVIPSFNKVATSLDIHQVILDGTRLMLAIELFKAESGEYPASLADLAPAYLPAIPTDPFTAKPYIYRRLKPGEDPTPDQHRPYLLYSTGFDAEDNNANVHPEGSFIPADPDCKPGFDIVINQPR